MLICTAKPCEALQSSTEPRWAPLSLGNKPPETSSQFTHRRGSRLIRPPNSSMISPKVKTHPDYHACPIRRGLARKTSSQFTHRRGSRVIRPPHSTLRSPKITTVGLMMARPDSQHMRCGTHREGAAT
eukprot:2717793-Pyramimonas_sp.AAC.3